MNSYNNNKIQQLMSAAGMTMAEMKRQFEITDHNTARRLFGGSEDIKVGRLLAIANFFNVSICDFFCSDNTPLPATPTPTAVTVVPEDKPVAEVDELKKLHAIELSHLKEMMDMRLHYEVEIASLKKDNDHLRAELKKREAAATSDTVGVQAVIHEHYIPEESYHSYAAEESGVD